MSAYFSPVGNEPQTNANGDPYSGGKWYTYLAGTTTPAATYTDSTGVTPLSNPIILNSRGMPTSNGVTPCTVWIPGGVSMKFVLTDSTDVVVAPTFDNINGINDPAFISTNDQWVALGITPTYISATSFSVPGDQTLVLQLNRRLRTTNTGGTIYSTITGSSYSAGSGLTTVTVANDSGVLDAGLSSVSYGLLSAMSPSVPASFNQFSLVRTLSASVAANALTVGITAGSMDFRSATATSAAINTRPYSALSLTVPNTATMGQSNGVGARLWIAAIDNAGTVELAIINTQLGSGQISPINESGFITTTLLDVAADNAGVWYSATARASVPFLLVGYIENTQATAGVWATAPSLIQPMGAGVRKPGNVIQMVQTVTGTIATGTTILPADNTIPQNTEGDQYMSQAITPTNAINTLEVDVLGVFSSNVVAGTGFVAALFQDATANALAAAVKTTSGVSYVLDGSIKYIARSGTTSATTFKVRAGATTAGTTTFNGTGAGGLMGGVLSSYIRVIERMA